MAILEEYMDVLYDLRNRQLIDMEVWDQFHSRYGGVFLNNVALTPQGYYNFDNILFDLMMKQ